MKEWVALGLVGLLADAALVAAVIWWLRIRRWRQR